MPKKTSTPAALGDGTPVKVPDLVATGGLRAGSGRGEKGGGEQKPRANRAQAAALSPFGCRGGAILQC